MKPKNWNKMNEKEKKEDAKELFCSSRGAFIISQALVIAIDELKKVDSMRREYSNIEDMEELYEMMFPLYRKEFATLRVGH